MKQLKRRIFLTTTLAGLMLAAFLGGCKKDKYVPIEGKCPVVVATNPANSATSVALNQVITVTFNELMDPKSFNQASFNLQGAAKIPGTVVYDGTTPTMSFTPSASLTPNTTYVGTMYATVKDKLGNVLQASYVWSFSTGNTLSPMVIATDPTNTATGVVLNKVVTANFSMPMDPLTINATNFMIKQGSTPITGVISYSGTTASFSPTSAFSANTVYSATLTTGVKNVSGAPLTSNYVWSFTTGTLTAPTVISTDPINNATGVVLNKTITASFSTAMDPLTINAANFELKEGSNVIAGTVSYAGTTASFVPTAALNPNLVYTATIKTGAKNLAGTPLANNYVWAFTTTLTSAPAPSVIVTSPNANATNVPLSSILTATFNMSMDPLTITSSTFKLKYGSTSVTGVVAYSGTTATFTPLSSLLSGTVYSATITTGAKNVSGTPMANDYVWNFTTIPSAGPPNVNLGSVARFGIIAGVGVSNNAGFSVINNLDVGISPGVRSSVTGFPPATIVNGAIYASDDTTPPGTAAMLIQAKADLTAAYLFAEGATTPAPATVAGDLGGQTLAPGIYKTTSSLLIQNGDLTLDAQGDVNAVWIFQIASGFTTVGGAGGNVILAGGAQAKNVFWQTGSSATIGDFTSFKGNILALTSITMNSGATAVGRMLCRNGSVVMTSSNIINKP
jgi:hypothetical protein